MQGNYGVWAAEKSRVFRHFPVLPFFAAQNKPDSLMKSGWLC